MAGLNLKLSVISDCTKQTKRRMNARNQGNKLQPDNNRSGKDASASAKAAYIHGALFLEKVFCGLQLRTTFADVNKIKLSKCRVSL